MCYIANRYILYFFISNRAVYAIHTASISCSVIISTLIKDDNSLVRGYHNTYKRQNWDTPAYAVTMDNRKISSQNNVHPGRYIGIDENGNK